MGGARNKTSMFYKKFKPIRQWNRKFRLSILVMKEKSSFYYFARMIVINKHYLKINDGFTQKFLN